MNKKGFTLIELLAVIIILGLVMAIAITGIGNLVNKTKERMLDEKITFIEESAILYGQDIKGDIVSSTKKYDGKYSCKLIQVKNLVPEYLEKDIKEGAETDKSIVDPTNDTNFLDNYNIILYYKNNRIHAIFDRNNNLRCV